MREKIYEIPVNEAFDKKCECPICILQRDLENNTVEFVLGPAMMEPDFRMETNKKGFCAHHYRLLFEAQNKLPLALVLDTHMDSLNEILNKTALLSKAPQTEAIQKELERAEQSCAACDKMAFIMDKYMDVIFYMWKKNPAFSEKFQNCKGFCLPHFNRLLRESAKYLSKKQAKEFTNQIITIEKREMARIKEEIHWFTQKFDYKNESLPWGNSKDAPIRTVEKLRGFLK